MRKTSRLFILLKWRKIISNVSLLIACYYLGVACLSIATYYTNIFQLPDIVVDLVLILTLLLAVLLMMFVFYTIKYLLSLRKNVGRWSVFLRQNKGCSHTAQSVLKFVWNNC